MNLPHIDPGAAVSTSSIADQTRVHQQPKRITSRPEPEPSGFCLAADDGTMAELEHNESTESQSSFKDNAATRNSIGENAETYDTLYSACVIC